MTVQQQGMAAGLGVVALALCCLAAAIYVWINP